VTLFALGRGGEAVAPLKACLEGNSLPPEALAQAHIKLAQVALGAGDRALAGVHLTEAEAARPRSALVAYLRAGIEFAERRYGPAAELLERLLDPEGGAARGESLDEGSLRLDHGNCLYHLGRVEEAAGEYRRAAELQPGSALVRYNLGNALYQGGRHGEALREFDAALSRDPSLDAARHNAWQCTLRLAEALEREGRDAELAALDVTGAPREMRRLVAAARLRAGQPESAWALLAELWREDRADDATGFLLAVALREQGQVRDSLEIFEQLAPRHGSDPRVLSQHALTLLDAGREEEATRLYGRALELDPSPAERSAA
jgi:tetratricopeptide (TPR) repeat protein